MSSQNPTEPAKGARRKGLLWFGVLVLLGGIGAGAALFVTSGSQYEDAVKSLQRAPVGCDTEFDFTGTGTFVFYTETKGVIGDIRGDCANTDTVYDSGDDRVRVTLTLTDDRGDEVDLDRESGIDYDRAGFVGSAVRSVTLDEPGTYTLSVESDDEDFAIAVGRNPKDGAKTLMTIAIAVAGAGIVLGLILILLGLRRRPAPAAPGGFGGATFAPATGFGPAAFGAAPSGPYQRPGPPVGGPPLVSPPQPDLPPAQYPQPPNGPGNWSAPSS